jgi:hypothetical protein
MNNSFATAALALAIGAAAISPTFAQAGAPAGRMMGMAGGGCPMMGMMGERLMGRGMMGQGKMQDKEMQMGAMADSRLANLKAELKITVAQAGVWKGYADAIKTRVDVMQGSRTSMMGAMDKGGAIERMDLRIKSMEAMIESMKVVKPATEKLYAALTAEQKIVADQLIGADCGAM